MSKKLILFLFIPALVSSLFYIPFLGRLPLEDADEATYALVMKDMVLNRHHLTLTKLDSPWPEKPPLLFWLTIPSVKLFGFNEFGLRFPIALFGILAILLTTLITYQLSKNKKTAILAGLILTTFPLFLSATRNLRMDVPVTAMILLAFLCFLKSPEKKIWALGIGSAIGLGIMLKSVIALLTLLPIISWSLVYKNWSWLKNPYLYLGGLIGLTIFLPWHLYEMYTLGPIFLKNYLGLHIFDRFTSDILHNQITNDYLLYVLFRFGQPWLTLFIASLAYYALYLIPKRKLTPANWQISSFLVFSSLALVFVFFLSDTKLVPYLIPSYPFIVIYIAITIQQIIIPYKKYLTFIFLALALFISFNEAFINTKLYITKPVLDAKPIGQILAKEDNSPIYLYEYQPDQTLIYYSQSKIEHLSNNSEINLSPPFFLIIPTPLIKTNPWLNNFPPLYNGIYLSLIKVK